MQYEHNYGRRGFFSGIVSGFIVSMAPVDPAGGWAQGLLSLAPGLLFAAWVTLPWTRAAGYAQPRIVVALVVSAVAFPLALLPMNLERAASRAVPSLSGLLCALMIWAAVNGPRSKELGPFVTVGVLCGTALGFRAQVPFVPYTLAMMALFALWQSSLAFILRKAEGHQPSPSHEGLGARAS